MPAKVFHSNPFLPQLFSFLSLTVSLFFAIVSSNPEMGNKKLKDPETNEAQSDPVAPQPNISTILSGDLTDKNAAASIFSYEKPFLRKPQQQQTVEASGIPDYGSAEQKNRKREEIEKEYEAIKYGAVGDNAGEEEKPLGWKVGEKRKALENPEDDLVPKEGFDDESKLLRTVFVGNLPLSVKKKALIKEFNKFGEVESVTVRIRSMPITDTKTPRKGAVFKKQVHEVADSVHACIVFKTEESAQASLSHNMPVIGDHHIRVDRAFPPHKQKRLTIANRNAKANAPKEIGSSKQAGAKRTMDSHTAESFFKKKAKNLR